MRLVKAHAYGNDFVLVNAGDAGAAGARVELTRALCERHRGVGADGVIFYTPRAGGARMDLLNADGSYSEVSGNGLRCLALWIALDQEIAAGSRVAIDTDAGRKMLDILEQSGPRITFRAAMGEPEDVGLQTLDVDGTAVEAVTLRVGNPQCVVLGEVSEARLHGLASKLAVHQAFPHGSNVELATVERPDRVRILIWERGVGPTEASGTGACAAAVAAMRYGGASRDVHVASPGGEQRVEWREDGLYLTGWAELIFDGRWAR